MSRGRSLAPDGGPICPKCATEHGWKWRRGCLATARAGICSVCGIHSPGLTTRGSWIKPGDNKPERKRNEGFES